MRKHFVLDTNVLLHDPLAMFQFADNVVVIPIYVLEEIDQFKKELSERGRNAREVCRRLDEFRNGGHHLSEGIELPGKGQLRVALGGREIPPPLRTSQLADNLILGVALAVRDANPEMQTILVTKDVNLRIRADAMGLHAEDYDVEQISLEELYTGHAELQVSAELISAFYQEGRLPLDVLLGGVVGERPVLYGNQYLLLRSSEGTSTALGRVDKNQQALLPVRKLREGVWGIRPRNKEQHFALDLLLNDEIKLVTLVGKAGTGKTLLAIAAGLQKVAEERVYHRLLVSRPIFPLGRDIGYLPGTMEEKLNPWMQPIYDNVEFLLGLSREGRRENRSAEELVNMGLMQIEALTYIRGRSIPNQFIIIDEAQNLTPHEVKTIITRVGEGTKIVFTGDPYQIDNPYVDASNNGLTTCVERFKGEPLAGHVTLVKGERSPLAELASNRL
ncbi:MAG: PhoH family protein [Myxococcales bacterium]|nr:PhoH family protein [Myxococcota bacterium]MDW8282512.1 PhoH family protein [Myxococcales bacterium]